LRVEAPGYEPSESRPFVDDEGDVTYDFKLVAGKTIVGRLIDEQSKPVVDAEVFVSSRSSNVSMQNGKSMFATVSMKTVEDGRFWVRPQGEPFAVFVFDRRGYAEATEEQLEKSPDVALQPWAAVEGQIVIGGKAGAGQTVVLEADRILGRAAGRAFYNLKTTADEEGRFRFLQAPPGEVVVSRELALEKGFTALRRKVYRVLAGQ
ncbi:MAG TPA: hypothetical protein VM238_13780, partial [Phycisphaerae bacterium]|nr:hypothetical protein [Phycisphaerae bacterium]